jgi:GNAT superfamily N-acetyltransferase
VPTIVPYRADLGWAFADLNRDWIERLFALEDADLKVLRDPQTAIVAPGGEIFFAIEGTEVVGTVAAVRHSATRFELAKMAVAAGHQGRGIGRMLGEEVIAFAGRRGASTLFLLTNSRLEGAIRLFARLGFRHAPLPPATDYARADVYMERPLPAQSPGT